MHESTETLELPPLIPAHRPYGQEDSDLIKNFHNLPGVLWIEVNEDTVFAVLKGPTTETRARLGMYYRDDYIQSFKGRLIPVAPLKSLAALPT